MDGHDDHSIPFLTQSEGTKLSIKQLYCTCLFGGRSKHASPKATEYINYFD